MKMNWWPKKVKQTGLGKIWLAGDCGEVRDAKRGDSNKNRDQPLWAGPES